MYVLKKDEMFFVLFTFEGELCFVKTSDIAVLELVTTLDKSTLMRRYKTYKFERVGVFVAEFLKYDPLNYRKIKFGKTGLFATDEYSFICHNAILSRSIENMPNTNDKIEVFEVYNGTWAAPEKYSIEIKNLDIIMNFRLDHCQLEVSKLRDEYVLLSDEDILKFKKP